MTNVYFCGLLYLSFYMAAMSTPLERTRSFSVATGTGNLFRPSFFNTVDKRSSLSSEKSPDVLDLDYVSKRSLALGRPNFQPGKRSMAVGRVGFRPGKRSIATGRSIFRPSKRSTDSGDYFLSDPTVASQDFALSDTDNDNFHLLAKILEEEYIQNQDFLRKFGTQHFTM